MPDRLPSVEDLLVVIPCFNEEKSVRAVVSDLLEEAKGAVPLVIDDGSTDRTGMAAKSVAATLRLHTNLGIGGAVQTGIKYACDKGYSWCLQLDGDGQHLPSEIRRLVEAARETGADIVVGSRFVEVNSFRPTFLRRLGIVYLRALIAFLSGVRVTDPTSGFRLLNRKAVEVFAKDYPVDFPEPASLVIGRCHGLMIREVGVRMRAREHGTSSIAGFKPLSYMIRVTFYMLMAVLRRYA